MPTHVCQLTPSERCIRVADVNVVGISVLGCSRSVSEYLRKLWIIKLNKCFRIPTVDDFEIKSSIGIAYNMNKLQLQILVSLRFRWRFLLMNSEKTFAQKQDENHDNCNDCRVNDATSSRLFGSQAIHCSFDEKANWNLSQRFTWKFFVPTAQRFIVTKSLILSQQLEAERCAARFNAFLLSSRVLDWLKRSLLSSLSVYKLQYKHVGIVESLKSTIAEWKLTKKSRITLGWYLTMRMIAKIRQENYLMFCGGVEWTEKSETIAAITLKNQ